MMFISNLGWISVQLEGFVGTFEVSVQAKASISILSRKKYRVATLFFQQLGVRQWAGSYTRLDFAMSPNYCNQNGSGVGLGLKLYQVA